MSPMEHIENIRKAKLERMRKLSKQDDKNFDPFPKNGKSRFKDDEIPIGANPFMEG